MAAKNTTKNTTKNVDALDTEGAPTVDFEFNGDSFTTKVLRGRKWRDIRDNLAALNGELGILQIESAIRYFVGADAANTVTEYDAADFIAFGQELAAHLNSTLGTPGE